MANKRVSSEGVNSCDAASRSQHSAAVLSVIGSGTEYSGMGMSRASSPEAEELKLAMEVGVIVGLSCEGQIGKLEEVLGQLVAEKPAKGIGGETGSHDLNES